MQRSYRVEDENKYRGAGGRDVGGKTKEESMCERNLEKMRGGRRGGKGKRR